MNAEINRIRNENWYSPLAAEPEVRKKKKSKKKRKRVLSILLICLIAAGVVGVAGYFVHSRLLSIRTAATAGAGTHDGSGSYGGYYSGDDSMPDSSEDFFSSYYTDTITESEEINIPRTELPVEGSLEMNSSDGTELTLTELYEQCSPAIVGIAGNVDGTAGYYWGTGFIISSDGLIVTNTHVVEGTDSCTVTLWDDTEYEAKLVGADSISDICVLKIEASGLPCAEIGDSTTLQVGDSVAAIGNPLGATYRMTLTNGIISGIERDVTYNGRTMSLLQTNTAINEGNSGGPLFNMSGQVIGVTNMKMMSSYSSIEGIGFAIPASTVCKVVNALLKDGEVKGRTSIGITVGTVPEAAMEKYGLPAGLYVSGVSEDSDAQTKGIRVGDVVTHVNGQPVTSTSEVTAIKDTLSVGDTLTLTIYRDEDGDGQGETFDVKIELMDTNDVYK